MEKRTIFAALSAIQSDLAKVGIEKAQRNQHGNYNFRGIDDVLNALAPILSAHGVVIMPSVQGFGIEQVTTTGGKPSRAATITVDYYIYDKHGDHVVHRAVGEAMDSSDKSLNKAMTAAFKYFIFQAFCIPVHGQEDADAEDPQIEVSKLPADQAQELYDLATQLDDPKSFFDWLKVPLNDVEAHRYTQLKSMLEKKLAREYAAAASAAGQADMLGEE